MDRGVKIAIFVASIVSLSLGLIWDQVLSQARNAVQREAVDELGPEIMQANVGPPEVARLQPPVGFETQPPANLPDPQQPAVDPVPQATPPAWQSWTEYEVVSGDSWWKLSHVTFKERGLSTNDLANANPGVTTLKPGMKIKIPPLPGAVEPDGAPTRESSSGQIAGYSRDAEPPPSAVKEYTVQDGDSWWRIAHRRFPELGKTSEEWEAANPGVSTLKPGMKLKVP